MACLRFHGQGQVAKREGRNKWRSREHVVERDNASLCNKNSVR